MQLTREDAYAFRRVLSKMDVPEDIKLSPVAQLLFDSLDPMNNQTGWQTLYDMVAKNHEVMQQVMYIDPKAEPPEDLKACDELYVPPLPKAAQLDDELIKAAEGGRAVPSRVYRMVEEKITDDTAHLSGVCTTLGCWACYCATGSASAAVQ
jgi:hypothetical protein